MSNKAKNCKESILVDVKNLLTLYDRFVMTLPKARRESGALRHFEDAGYQMIHHFTIAREMTSPADHDERRRHVDAILGCFGELVAAFEIMMQMKAATQKKSTSDLKGEMYLFSDSAKLGMARCLEKIEEGCRKWRNSMRS